MSTTTPMIGASRARHVECTLKQYHARPEWSRSQFEDAINEDGDISWPLFYGLHVAEPRLFHKSASTAMDVGTVAHVILSSPGGIDTVVAIIPPEVLGKGGRRGTNAWKEWRDTHPGKIDMKEAEFEPVRQMVRNVYQHPRGDWLMRHALHYEFGLVWEDSETSLQLRACSDLLVEFRGRVLVVDFKTTRCRTPRTFAKAAAELGYHRQAAWYSEAVELFGYEVAGFLFLTVDKSPAHECRVYELPQHAIELGRRQNAANRRELARRLDENDWTDPLGQDAIEVDLPQYVYYNERN